MPARDRHRQLAFDGDVTWAARRHPDDPTIVGTLRVDVLSDPRLAAAASIKSKVDALDMKYAAGLGSWVRGNLRDVPWFGSFVDGVEHVMGVPVDVLADGLRYTLRGSLRFEQRPGPADEPVTITLAIGS